MTVASQHNAIEITAYEWKPRRLFLFICKNATDKDNDKRGEREKLLKRYVHPHHLPSSGRQKKSDFPWMGSNRHRCGTLRAAFGRLHILYHAKIRLSTPIFQSADHPRKGIFFCDRRRINKGKFALFYGIIIVENEPMPIEA